MTDLTIGGETFNVLIEGDETLPVLMLSNPLGADLHIWDAQIKDLLKHFRIVRYNQRGHGTSVADAGPYSIDRLGRDAIAILDALGIDKAHWLGMSLGGAVGQWLLINAPERIERAVLANTAAQFGSAEAWNERIVAVQKDGMEAVVARTMDRWFSPDLAESNPERLAAVKQALLATPAQGYAATCAALRDMDLREGLLQVQRPVLVIAGSKDQSTTPEQSALIAASIPGAKHVTLDTRHIAAIEDAAGFTKAVIDFLTSKLPAQTASRKASLPRPIARRPAGRRTPTTRTAAKEAIVRRGAVKTASTKTQAPDVRVATPAKAPRAKRPAPVSAPAPKRSAAKAAPAPKTGRKTSATAAPAKRVAAKPVAAKPVAAKAPPAKVSASKSATPKANTRGQRVAAAPPSKAVKATKAPAAKATKATAAKAPSRKATSAASGRAKTAQRGAAKPVPAKTATRAAKPGATRRGAAVAKAPAKRSVAAPAKSRAVGKPKTAAKTSAKTTTKSARAKAPAAKTKAPVKPSKAAKPAAKTTARKPVARAPAKRTAPRRKA